jgi:hypothetical protein
MKSGSSNGSEMIRSSRIGVRAKSLWSVSRFALSVRLHGHSPFCGLPLEIEPWTVQQVTDEMRAEIQADLVLSADTPPLAAPVAVPPEFALAAFNLHMGVRKARSIRANAVDNPCELLWKICGIEIGERTDCATVSSSLLSIGMIG